MVFYFLFSLPRRSPHFFQTKDKKSNDEGNLIKVILCPSISHDAQTHLTLQCLLHYQPTSHILSTLFHFFTKNSSSNNIFSYKKYIAFVENLHHKESKTSGLPNIFMISCKKTYKVKNSDCSYSWTHYTSFLISNFTTTLYSPFATLLKN